MTIPSLLDVRPSEKVVRAALEQGCRFILYPIEVKTTGGELMVWGCTRGDSAVVEVLRDEEGRPIPGPQMVQYTMDLVREDETVTVSRTPTEPRLYLEVEGAPVVAYELGPGGAVDGPYLARLGNLEVDITVDPYDIGTLRVRSYVLARLERLQKEAEEETEQAGRERA